MSQIEKTVFISYRRKDIYTARAVYQHLRAQNYDVFLDYQSIDSGAFDRIILNQIKARAHFLLILTETALERCTDPADWLRREIETAFAFQRNIVPLMFDEFNWNSVDQWLPTDNLKLLKNYNSVRVPADYFEEAMERLSQRFLNVPLAAVLHPTPAEDQGHVAGIIAKTDAAIGYTTKTPLATIPIGRKSKLNDVKTSQAAEFLIQGNDHLLDARYEKAIELFSAAIRLDDKNPLAYNNRGNAHLALKDYANAIEDYTTAIQLKPDYPSAFLNRGRAQVGLLNYDKAIEDYTQALLLKPNTADIYHERASAYYVIGNYLLSVEDNTAALEFEPENSIHYNNRAEAYFALGNYDGALADFKRAYDLDNSSPFALAGLAIASHALGKIDIARELWTKLVAFDKRYATAAWTGKKLRWVAPLIAEAEKLLRK